MSAETTTRRPDDLEAAARALRAAGRPPPLLTGSAPADRSALPGPVRRALGEGNRVLLSTDRLSGIEEYRPEDLTVVVGAGTRVETLQERLRAEGQWLPLTGDALARSVGGLVAAAPATPYEAEFGPVRRQVLAVRTVSHGGERLDWGRGVVKDVAGYDLPRLVCGSRGRLGLLVRLTLRVWPLPRERRRYAVRDPEDAAATVSTTVGVDAEKDWRPAAETWRWRADGQDDPPLVVEIAGSGAAVDARGRRLRRWCGKQGLELRERPAEHPVDPPPPRPAAERRGGTARPSALRFRVHPRYVGRTVAALRASGVASRIAAYPREGVIGAALRPVDRPSRALEAAADTAPDAATTVVRGRPPLHEAAEARRDGTRVAVERRVVEALGGRERAWAADFV